MFPSTTGLAARKGINYQLDIKIVGHVIFTLNSSSFACCNNRKTQKGSLFTTFGNPQWSLTHTVTPQNPSNNSIPLTC